ncbi:helix-hairpin-helix domain-containing protein [Ferrimonas balearica]|uniref:helix-hairpin-helix domain-containing protein n=1 Tax=Ferrimonas balearica TaxID=44012 RepID=UPI001C9947AF|nr:helix-hairpin-helix domain-containing protein [Ferrimonas balearica]MBY5990811.1 helix-hairpin-helix domain-containing protein [Ferrimonas balearica]
MWKAALMAFAIALTPVWALANPQTNEVQQSARVNINTADAQALADALTGVGPSKAEAIVDYREQHGRFNAVEELLHVRGIGEELLARNRERIQL